MKSTWSHHLSPNDITSAMTTTWGSGKRMQIDVTGAHVTGSLSGSVAVQTPWAAARDWRAETKTQYGAGKIMSSSSVKVSFQIKSFSSLRASYDFPGKAFLV